MKSIATNTKQHHLEILDAVSPKMKKVAAVSPQLLLWTHYRELIRIENADARKWYEQKAQREMWTTRTLHRNISSQMQKEVFRQQQIDSMKDGNNNGFINS